MKRTTKTAPKASPLYARVRQILESARITAARSVNTTQVIANWLIGQEIVEEEQKGKGRADYGEGLLRDLAEKLHGEYGFGYGLTNLRLFRKFYLLYPEVPAAAKGHALRDEFSEVAMIADAADRKSKTALAKEGKTIGDAVRSESWRPVMGGRCFPMILAPLSIRTFRNPGPGSKSSYAPRRSPYWTAPA